MKWLLIVGDGMADEPLEALGGRTPLQQAETPYLDALARLGRCGRLSTSPEGCPPGSETALLSLLGYDPRGAAEARGALEAAGLGLDLSPGELALRCNLLSLDGEGRLLNHNAGQITSPEAAELIACLQERLGSPEVQFHPGVSFRGILCLKNADPAVLCAPPQDIRGERAEDHPVRGAKPEALSTARRLNELVSLSQKILAAHPVNLRRRVAGLPMADTIWPWAPGCKLTLTPLPEKYGFTAGAVVAGVPLARGIGASAGLRVIEVPGATGYTDTDYEGKARAALQALQTDDFVLLHLEAPDECSHEGDVAAKITAIEALDAQIVGPLFESLKTSGEDFTLAVLPDHPTLCRSRAHSAGPVPFLIFRTGDPGDATTRFDEAGVLSGNYGLLEGDGFIRRFFFRD